MIDSLVDKVKGFLFSPGEAFQKAKADETGNVLTYFAILVVVNAILSAIIAAIWTSMTPMYAHMLGGAAVPILVFFIVLVAEFVVTLVFGAWLHLWVYVLGGRKGIMQSIKSVIYGSTPRLLLGWIPFIGIIFLIWSVVLWALGIRDLQEMSTGKAILAVAIAILIPLILILLLAAYLITSYVMTSEPLTAPTNLI
ncbi:MAG: YIP1 family protein [Methanoregula sp.]|nr:YIP1 family protein [Methanoregula sp.]